MTPELEKVKILLQNVDRVARHQEEIKKVRGESFNVFSILKMESRENETHSAFLGELLNPKGSHLMNDLFLHRFLQTVSYSGKLDTNTAKVSLEKSIGARNDLLKTGGRIDIYIYDEAGNSISIENKIYASDQFAQIERYINHNKGKNTVYYLTRDGDSATKDSKGTLVENEDYHCISYKETIIIWLEKCLKESVEQPILRESIRQYIILIKKLTNQMTDQNLDKEIHNLIAKNYNAAKVIGANLAKVEEETARYFLTKVQKDIDSELNKMGFECTIDGDLNKSWSGLTIKHENWDGIIIRLIGNQRLIDGSGIYGISAHGKIWERSQIKEKLENVAFLKDGFSENIHWPYYKYINFLSDTKEVVFFNEKMTELIIKEVSNILIKLAIECEVILIGIPRLN